MKYGEMVRLLQKGLLDYWYNEGNFDGYEHDYHVVH
jgi:hypothetical protein